MRWYDGGREGGREGERDGGREGICEAEEETCVGRTCPAMQQRGMGLDAAAARYPPPANRAQMDAVGCPVYRERDREQGAGRAPDPYGFDVKVDGNVHARRDLDAEHLELEGPLARHAAVELRQELRCTSTAAHQASRRSDPRRQPLTGRLPEAHAGCRRRVQRGALAPPHQLTRPPPPRYVSWPRQLGLPPHPSLPTPHHHGCGPHRCS